MTRVLIVDDKEENVYYLRTLLGAQGCQVDSARHGAEALVKARKAPPDIIVSDLLMPVMDGYTLLRHWKMDARLKGVPFVVYTATYTEPEDERLALNMGADAFILKPAEPDAFVARLSEVRAKTSADESMPLRQPLTDEKELLREYSATLIRKLEEKTLQLEESNRSLQRDITVRIEVEAALRDSEERFRQLAETIDDVFWLSDPDERRFFYVSPAYEGIWGKSCASLYATPESWLEAVHPEDRERVKKAIPRHESGEWELEFRIVRPDGALRWIKERAYPIRDARGDPLRLAGVSRDVTEHRRLEAQFLQAQKMEAVGRLASGVAHDFNNLLSVILGYTGLVLDDTKPGDRWHAEIEQVRRAGERASELTQQLLAFSRHQALQTKVLDLSQVMLDMESLLRRLLGEDIELSLRLAPVPALVDVDPGQIEQIVMNLAVNARDAMPQGGKLHIQTENVELGAQAVTSYPGLAPGACVGLSVMDTGIGMDARTRERIFEPFFTTKEVGKGTGLGLSTVYGIVKQSKGGIGLQSAVGKGSTFKIYLPRSQSTTPDDVGAPAPTCLHGSETILLVEDDEQVRMVARAILKRHGYDVLDAPDGEAALRIGASHPGKIHLLLTDAVMPRMSGLELAGRLGTTRPEMRGLCLSGYADDSIPHRQMLDGMTFLQKPAAPQTLLRKVREVLDAPR